MLLELGTQWLQNEILFSEICRSIHRYMVCRVEVFLCKNQGKNNLTSRDNFLQLHTSLEMPWINELQFKTKLNPLCS